MLAAVVVAACLTPRASSEGTALVGETCSDTNDCYDGKACLGGRCCEFTQSQYTDDYTGNVIARCASCADTSGESLGFVMHARRGSIYWIPL